MEERIIAPCGLDCTRCNARIATINNDDALRVETAALWNKMNGFDLIKPEHINCMGCLGEGVKTYYCSEQCAIRKCVFGKDHTSCAQCRQMKGCATLAQITEHSPEAKANLGM